jgi:polygalacturonase
MPNPKSISVLISTPRTLTIELIGTKATDRLPEPLRYELKSEGALVQEGDLVRPVLTLEDLVPGTPYEFGVSGFGTLDIVAPSEDAFIDIRDFGACEGDTNNAGAIAAAIAAAPVGATIYVPPGQWQTGPLFLKSHLTVYLPSGAILKGIGDRAAYPILAAFDSEGQQNASWEGIPADCYASLITLVDAKNVTVAGLGTIDGAGAEGDWWSWPKETRDGARRPRTVFANRCHRLFMAGVTVRNSPSWTIHPLDCSELVFADLEIENPPNSPNTDGLNPESSIDVQIVGVRISVGDDCIAIKAGKIWPNGLVPQPTRNVRIRHCLLKKGHGGVVIGSEMSGSVTDVTIANCRMVGTDRGLRIKTRRGRGGQVGRIAMQDCEMDSIGSALVVNAHYFCDPDGKSDAVQNRTPAPVSSRTPQIHDVSFERIDIRNLHHAVAYVLGLAEAPVSGLRVRDITVGFAPEAVPGHPDMALNLPALRHAGVVTENVKDPSLARIAMPAMPIDRRETA